MATDTTEIAGALSPVLEARGLDLVDVEVHGAQLTVFVDRAGGVGLDELGDATRDVSAVLDALDPMPGRYTLSLSSPGLERRLRTPEHFRRFIGATVSVKLQPGTDSPRRLTGRLDAADDTAITVAGRAIPYGEIERAQTVFEWGPAPKPGKPRPGTSPAHHRDQKASAS